jgi:DUF4097 and DUF4098 domain-containing protein YvlB
MMKRLAVVLALAFLVSTFALASGNAFQRRTERAKEARDSEEYAFDDCQRQLEHSMTNYASRLVAEDKQTLSRAAVQLLDVEGSRNGGVSIKGWDQPDILVRACKLVGADDDAAAQALLNRLTISTEGGRVRANEPEKGEGARQSWVVQFTIYVPRDLEIKASVYNGGLALQGLTGKIKGNSHNGGIAISRSGGAEAPIELFAQNGGISLKDVRGKIDARTANGGISLSGGSGEVKVVSQNGGIVINLPEGGWSGETLEARSENGGMVLHVPQGFSSGIEAETSAHVRIDCRLPDCPQQLQTESADRGPKRVQIGSSSPVVHVSTRNGGLQILPAK